MPLSWKQVKAASWFIDLFLLYVERICFCHREPLLIVAGLTTTTMTTSICVSFPCEREVMRSSTDQIYRRLLLWWQTFKSCRVSAVDALSLLFSCGSRSDFTEGVLPCGHKGKRSTSALRGFLETLFSPQNRTKSICALAKWPRDLTMICQLKICRKSITVMKQKHSYSLLKNGFSRSSKPAGYRLEWKDKMGEHGWRMIAEQYQSKAWLQSAESSYEAVVARKINVWKVMYVYAIPI